MSYQNLCYTRLLLEHNKKLNLKVLLDVVDYEYDEELVDFELDVDMVGKHFDDIEIFVVVAVGIAVVTAFDDADYTIDVVVDPNQMEISKEFQIV